MKQTGIKATLIFLAGLSILTLGPIHSQEPPARVPEGTFMPNFRDVEIQDFLKTMAQVTQRNILVDDSVRGKITIVAYRPIPVSEAMDFLKQVLEVRGFAVVEEGSLLKVVASERARHSSLPESEDAAGIVTQVMRVPPRVNITDLATLLTGIVGGETNIASYRPTNSLIITGYSRNVRRAMEIASEVIPEDRDSDLDTSEAVHIYRAMNLPAESLAEVLVRLDSPQVEDPTAEQEGQQRRGEEKIRAVAHKESNSIIVTASQREWTEIRNIIEQLDQQRRQILLEVLIAEVTSSSLNDFGIDWRYMGRDAAHTQFNTDLAIEGNLVDPETGRITGNNTLSGFSLGFLERGGELLGIFNANIHNQNFNVLSAPQVLTLDNQEAEINVGQDVPVRTQERTSGGGTAEATVNSFEYRPAGIKLQFTPNINDVGNIILDLFAEVTNIEGGGSSITNPTFNKRNVQTFVTVNDRQTIVIGGLVSSERQQAVRKIPLLGDIPLLGFMFRRTTYTNRKTNLMVFITPHILDSREEADRITNYRRNEQLDASRRRTNEVQLWPESDVRPDREEQFRRLDSSPIPDPIGEPSPGDGSE